MDKVQGCEIDACYAWLGVYRKEDKWLDKRNDTPVSYEQTRADSVPDGEIHAYMYGKTWLTMATSDKANVVCQKSLSKGKTWGDYIVTKLRYRLSIIMTCQL